MRKRRLYRHSQRVAQQGRPQPHRQRLPHPQAQQELSEFDQGVQQGLEMAATQQGRVLAEVRREALVAAHSEPFMQMARRGGFDEGFAAGMQASQKAAAPKDAQFTYVDVENARKRGVAEGKSSVAGIPNVDEARMRRKMVDEMLEDCRVIAESNESMAPGVNAVRHMIKKRA